MFGLCTSLQEGITTPLPTHTTTLPSPPLRRGKEMWLGPKIQVMNKEISGAWLLNINPLFGLPFYENKKNTVAKILTKSLLETNTYLIQILKDYFDSTLYIQAKLLNAPFISSGPKGPWEIRPTFTQQVPVQAALFKDGLCLPIETQKLSAHNLQWFLLFVTKFHELGLLLLFWGAFVCFFTEEVLSHNRMVKWLWSLPAAAWKGALVPCQRWRPSSVTRAWLLSFAENNSHKEGKWWNR